jgi:hypothetical protein
MGSGRSFMHSMAAMRDAPAYAALRAPILFVGCLPIRSSCRDFTSRFWRFEGRL